MIEIQQATDDDRDKWDAYVMQHPDSLAYHRYAWGAAIRKVYQHRQVYLMAFASNQLVGVLPLIEFKVPLFGRTMISLPFCDVGGILADNPQVADKLFQAACKEGQVLGANKIVLRNGCRLDSPQAIPSQGKVRMLLDLPDNSAALLAQLKAKLRSQVKKPLRDGLTADVGGLELVDSFYQVFCENMRDLGSPVHSLSWIRAVLTEFGTSAKIGVVRLADGTIAAAGLILQHGSTVSIPWASSLRKYNRHNPNMMLYWTFLAHAADNGFAWFDFGRSTPGEGTYKFKAQWGAKPAALNWRDYTCEGSALLPENSDSKLRSRVESVWQKLPLPFCNFVGPLVRRHVSL